jgi:hypothetical protein
MKLVLKLAAALVILLVLGVVAVFFFVDRIARSAVERGATYALGVQTTLGSADVGITSGEFGMMELRVDNPEGFPSDHFMTMGSGEVAVDLGTLRQDVVELPRLELDKIDLRLDKKGAESNYKVIIDHLKGLQESKDDGAPPAPEEGGKRFVIKEVVVTDVNVEADLVGGGELTKVRVPIKEIRLTDVGSGSGHKRGLSLSELTGVVVEAILAAVVANAEDLPDDLANDLGGLVQGLDGLEGILTTVEGADGVQTLSSDDAAKAIEEIGKGVGGGDDIGKAVEGLGDLFKKKDGK